MAVSQLQEWPGEAAWTIAQWAPSLWGEQLVWPPALLCVTVIAYSQGQVQQPLKSPSTALPARLVSWAREGAGWERHLPKDLHGLGRAALCSCCLRLLPLAPPVMTRWFFVAFQTRILKFGAALQNKPSGPGDSSGNTPLPVAPDEGGRRGDSCLPFLAGDSYKHGWLTLCAVIYLVVSLSRVYHAIWLCECKGSGSVVVAVGITKTAKICLI